MNGIKAKLSKSELDRYDRQMMIPDWGEEGQKKLKSSTVVVIGVGGLGCPASLYLAAAGIGKLRLIDRDRFELSNLNRQILGWQTDVGRSKAEAAAEKLEALNPEIEIEPLVMEITRRNIGGIIQNADVVVDALDNWKTRFIVNKRCVEEEIPLVHAGIFGMYGQMMTIVPGKGPCLRCLLPENPGEISRFPVPGATPALFATLQVMETLKLIVGFGEPLKGRILFFDGRDMSFTIIDIEKRSECSVCGYL